MSLKSFGFVSYFFDIWDKTSELTSLVSCIIILILSLGLYYCQITMYLKNDLDHWKWVLIYLLCLSEWGDVGSDADSAAQSFSSHHRATGHGAWRRV